MNPKRHGPQHLECGDRSPLSNWETCLPVTKRGHVRALHSEMQTHPIAFVSICLLLLILRAPAAVLYVDGNSANPTPPYADLSTAANTIQAAVDAATNGDLVLVNDGYYQDGFQTVANGVPGIGNVTNRLVISKQLTVQSINGPTAAYISGGGIYRCVYLTNGAALNGFTLENGIAGYTNRIGLFGHSTVVGNGGGVCGGSLSRGVVSNCVLTANRATSEGGGAYDVALIRCQLNGNSAAMGGGAFGCTLNSCNITGNSTADYGVTGPAIPQPNAGGGICDGTAMNCVVAGNKAGLGGGIYAVGKLINCTIVNNSAAFNGGVGYGSYNGLTIDVLTNCLVYFNTAGTNDNYASTSSLVFDHCCTFPLPSGAGDLTNDPGIVDFAGGDFHLQSSSLCINSGNNSAVISGTDADGNARIAGGTVDIGAYEFATPASKLSYAWAQQYGFPTDGSADLADPDGDGMNNWQEFVAGTNPTNAASVLAMTVAYPVSSFNWTIVKWQSVDTRNYFLLRSTNLSAPSAFSLVGSNITGQAGTTLVIDATATNGGAYFYRVGVQ